MIYEGSRRLTDDLKARHPEIDWRAVANAGNAYRHGYDSLDDDRLWETALHAFKPIATIARWELKALAADDLSAESDGAK